MVGLAISATAGRPVFVEHLIAVVLALLALEWLSALDERWVGKPALGLGDAKLAAMGGAWLGLVSGGLRWRWAWRCWLMPWQAALMPWLGL